MPTGRVVPAFDEIGPRCLRLGLDAKRTPGEEFAGGSFAVRDGRAFKRDRAFVTGPLSIIRSDTANPWPWKPVAQR